MPEKSSSSVRVFYPKYEREQLIKLLKERVKALKKKMPLVKVVLFGSYARGNYNAFSDVDILVIYKDPKDSQDYKKVRKTLNLPGTEVHVYTVSEYRNFKEIIDRMISGGVELLEQEN